VVRAGGEAATDREALLIRYADDAVIVFYLKTDADRVLAVLPKRFGKFGLTLHPDKTRLVRFTRPGGKGNKGDPSHPGSFDFLVHSLTGVRLLLTDGW